MTRHQAARVRLIRSRRSYKTQELAAQLQVSPQTVLRWHKQGLQAIDQEARALLFMGDVVKEFLTKQVKKRKHQLKPDEFFCPRCRCPRLPKLQAVKTDPTGKRMGRDRQLVFLRAECSECGCPIVKFATVSGGKSATQAASGTRTESKLEWPYRHCVGDSNNGV